MNQYEMLIGEPWDFKGPDGQNRVLVDFVRTVIIPNSNREEEHYILLKVITPFQDHGELVEYMIAAPRHTGDTVDEIIQLGGIVGVSRIRQGVPITEDQSLTLNKTVYFIIGRLNRLSTTNY